MIFRKSKRDPYQFAVNGVWSTTHIEGFHWRIVRKEIELSRTIKNIRNKNFSPDSHIFHWLIEKMWPQKREVIKKTCEKAQMTWAKCNIRSLFLYVNLNPGCYFRIPASMSIFVCRSLIAISKMCVFVFVFFPLVKSHHINTLWWLLLFFSFFLHFFLLRCFAVQKDEMLRKHCVCNFSVWWICRRHK